MLFEDWGSEMMAIGKVMAAFFCLVLGGISENVAAKPIFIGRSSTSGLVSVDTANGILQEVANVGTNYIQDMAFDSNGLLWTTTGYSLISYDVSTGGVVNNFALGSGDYKSLAFNQEGRLYVGRSSTSDLVSIDTTSGIQLEVAKVGTNYIQDMAFGANGLLWTTTGSRLISYDVNTGGVVDNFALGSGDYNSVAFNQAGRLYAGRSSTSDLVSVDTMNGIQKAVANVGTNYIQDMVFDANGLLWTTTGYRLISYDVNTGGVVNSFALGPGDYHSLATPPASVPEPQTIFLVLAGICLLGKGGWKINRTAVSSRSWPKPIKHLGKMSSPLQ
jgi:hypothetical protein